MRRVLCVLALLCIGLSCAAQENKLRCGSASPTDRHCAATLNAAGKNEKTKIWNAQRLYVGAKTQANKLTPHVHSFSNLCDKAEEHINNFKQTVASMKYSVNKTEGYLQEFTGLKVQKDLEMLQQTSKKASDLYRNALEKQNEVCHFYQEFSTERESILKALDEVEAAVNGLKTKFSETALEQTKQKAKSTKQEAEKAKKNAEKMEIKIERKAQGIEDVATAVGELNDEFQPVFEDVKSAYSECYKQFRSKLRSAHARDPSDTDHEKQMKLQTCQKKK